MVVIFVQPSTEFDSDDISVDLKLIEDFRYRSNSFVLGQLPLVANMSLYKDPAALLRLGFPLHNFSQAEPLSHFVFVTASDDSYFHIAMDAVARTQSYCPNHLIYFYDLSDGVLDNKVDTVSIILSVIVHSKRLC